MLKRQASHYATTKERPHPVSMAQPTIKHSHAALMRHSHLAQKRHSSCARLVMIQALKQVIAWGGQSPRAPARPASNVGALTPLCASGNTGTPKRSRTRFVRSSDRNSAALVESIEDELQPIVARSNARVVDLCQPLFSGQRLGKVGVAFRHLLRHVYRARVGGDFDACQNASSEDPGAETVR
jgi:hypothetical protein